MKQQYTSLEAVFHNSLLLHFNSLEFQIEGQDCSLKYLSEYPKFEPKLSLALEMLQQPILIDCFDTSFLALHPDTSSLDNFTELPKQLQEALAEYIFENSLHAFSKVLDIPLTFLQTSEYNEQSTFYQFAFMLTFQEKQVPLLFHIPTPCLEYLLPYLRKLPPKKTDISHVHLSYAIEIGEVDLKLAELQNLEKNDIIIPDTFLLKENDQHAILHLLENNENLPSYFCSLEKNKLTLEKILNITQDSTMQENTVNNEENQEIVEKAPLNLDEITIKVSFELERREMPLTELQNLQIGTNILLESDIDSPVTLVVGNKAFAKARIVSIDDAYAVQLTQLLK